MSALRIIATIVAKAECKETILNALYEVSDATCTEEGNISYIVHVDVKNPLKFVIIEEWQSQAAINFHNQTSHFLSFKEALDGKIESLAIDVLREIY